MAIFDVTEAYFNTDTPEDKYILLNIEGKFVDIMYEVKPENEKNVSIDNGVRA